MPNRRQFLGASVAVAVTLALAGISPEREAQVLAAWRAKQAGA